MGVPREVSSLRLVGAAKVETLARGACGEAGRDAGVWSRRSRLSLTPLRDEARVAQDQRANFDMTQAGDRRTLILRCADAAAPALTGAAAQRVERGMSSAPPRPGLYAIHAAAPVWEELGLGAPPDVRPLYLGKAEASLAGRDVSTHFGYVREGRRTSVTGYSTLRRSLAALLRDVRGFRAQPRSVAKPGHYASYGLSSAQDEELSAWMRERLRLSCWEMSHEIAVPELGLVERAVFRRLLPPLNLADIVTPWRPRVVAARQAMTAEARAWRASD
jgi:hypothetical protein